MFKNHKMLINVYCPMSDLHFSVYVGSDLKLEDFKALCAQKCGISVKKQQLFLNNVFLVGDNKNLESLNCTDNALIVLKEDIAPSSSATSSTPHSSNKTKASHLKTTSFSTEDFKNGLSDPKTFQKLLLQNPSQIEEVRSIYPPVINAMLNKNKVAFSNEFYKFCDLIGVQPFPTYEDAVDIEAQKKIHSQIQRQNIDENMAIAMETTPESFIEVVMLWINVKVNGYPIKAFVDTGAQMTIMSSLCAKKCNLMRLVDTRWEGLARGVGTQKILGRIHLAQIQIEKTVFPCAFAVLEDQPMDLLFGLDMLRRHLCVIDLRQNALIFESCKTKTHFLPESELPPIGQSSNIFTPFPSGICRRKQSCRYPKRFSISKSIK